MKNRLMYLLLLGLAFLSFFLPISMNNIFEIIVIPFSLLGNLLRAISLRQEVFNIISIILYVLLSLVPIMLLVVRIRKHHVKFMDIVFHTTFTVELFFILYFFINPHLLVAAINPTVLAILTSDQNELTQTILLFGLASLGYLTLLVYLTLIVYKAKTLNVKKIMIVLLDLGVFVFMLTVFQSNIPVFIAALNNSLYSLYDKILALIVLIGSLSVKGMSIYLFIIIKDFVKKLDEKPFDEQLVILSNRIYCNSFRIIVLTFLTQFIIILYQLVFISQLLDIKMTLNIPFLSLIVAIFSFLLAKYFRKVNDLHEDHSLII